MFAQGGKNLAPPWISNGPPLMYRPDSTCLDFSIQMAADYFLHKYIRSLNANYKAYLYLATLKCWCNESIHLTKVSWWNLRQHNTLKRHKTWNKPQAANATCLRRWRCNTLKLDILYTTSDTPCRPQHNHCLINLLLYVFYHDCSSSLCQQDAQCGLKLHRYHQIHMLAQPTRLTPEVNLNRTVTCIYCLSLNTSSSIASKGTLPFFQDTLPSQSCLTIISPFFFTHC